MESSEENEKIYSNNNDLLLDIKKELEQIIEYIQINLTTNKDRFLGLKRLQYLPNPLMQVFVNVFRVT